MHYQAATLCREDGERQGLVGELCLARSCKR